MLEIVKYTRAWTFESPTDIELNGLHQAVGEPSWQDRLKGRWTFLDADSADPESLDDGPRPSDRDIAEGGTA